MINYLSDPLFIWSVRDVMRRPLEWLLLTLTLALITALPGIALLLVQGLSDAAQILLADSPSLVIRKIAPTGWQPVPVTQGLTAIEEVPGVVRAYPRIWGVVAGPEGPLTVIGTRTRPGSDGSAGIFEPGRGEVLVGPGVTPGLQTGLLNLSGFSEENFKIVGLLERQTAIVSNDIVVMHPSDARDLLGLPVGYASDIAVDVNHADEETAIIPDLIEALPWTARITTRTESMAYYTGAYTRRGGIVMIAVIPALTALCVLVTATVRERLGRRFEVGLLKALGWTTADIVHYFMLRALFIGVPAVCLGMVGVYAAVFWPGVQWPGYLLFGWQGRAPGLYLSAGGSLLVLVQIAAITLVPFLVATLVPALKVATADTQALFEGSGI